MNTKVNRGRLLGASVAIVVMQMVVFSIVWANPVVKMMLAEFVGHPSRLLKKPIL